LRASGSARAERVSRAVARKRPSARYSAPRSLGPVRRHGRRRVGVSAARFHYPLRAGAYLLTYQAEAVAALQAHYDLRLTTA
jgi:hypothetical protein